MDRGGTLRASPDDGPGRRRGRDRDPGLLRPRLPVRAAFPLTPRLRLVGTCVGEVDCAAVRASTPALMPFGALRHHQRRPQPGRQPLDPVPGRRLARADRLDLLRRPAPDRGPGAGRLRDGRLAVPVRRHDRLLDPAPAGVPRRHARARARDPRLGAARAPARGAVLPELRATRSSAPFCAARTASARVKDPCESCGKPIDPRWSVCPYCETPQRGPPAGAPRAEPRREAAAQERAAQRRAERARRAHEPPRPPARAGTRPRESARERAARARRAPPATRAGASATSAREPPHRPPGR